MTCKEDWQKENPFPSKHTVAVRETEGTAGDAAQGLSFTSAVPTQWDLNYAFDFHQACATRR